METIVSEHGSAVNALLCGLERDRETREELWNDVFDLAYRRIDEVDMLTPAQQRLWLLRVGRNLTANMMRRSGSRRRAFDRLTREPIDTAISAEAEYFNSVNLQDHGRTVDAVHRAWRELNAEQREVLALDALGHKGPAIAEQLGITHQAARSRLMRARQALLEKYAGIEVSVNDR